MYAPVSEAQAGSGDEILDRRGDEHVTGRGKGEDPSPEVNGDPCHATPDQLAFASVESGSTG